MSNKTRSIIKVIAIILVLLSVTIKLHWISIPTINGYIFWMVIMGFGLVLLSSK